MIPSEIASLQNSRWQIRKERPKNGDMAKRAKGPVSE